MLKEVAMCRLFTVAMSGVVLASAAMADTINVPGEQPTIQIQGT